MPQAPVQGAVRRPTRKRAVPSGSTRATVVNAKVEERVPRAIEQIDKAARHVARRMRRMHALQARRQRRSWVAGVVTTEWRPPLFDPTARRQAVRKG